MNKMLLNSLEGKKTRYDPLIIRDHFYNYGDVYILLHKVLLRRN